MYNDITRYRKICDMKQCKYICTHGKCKGMQCPEESNDKFCSAHLAIFYWVRGNYLNVISVEQYDEGELISFYSAKHHQYIEKIIYEKKWLDMSSTTDDLNAINMLNFTYYKYKKCINKWITMYLVFNYYIGDVAKDIWLHIAYHYIDR